MNLYNWTVVRSLKTVSIDNYQKEREHDNGDDD